MGSHEGPGQCWGQGRDGWGTPVDQKFGGRAGVFCMLLWPGPRLGLVGRAGLSTPGGWEEAPLPSELPAPQSLSRISLLFLRRRGSAPASATSSGPNPPRFLIHPRLSQALTLGSQLPKHHPEDGSQALEGIRPASEDSSADNWGEAENPPRLSSSAAHPT